MPRNERQRIHLRAGALIIGAGDVKRAVAVNPREP